MHVRATVSHRYHYLWLSPCNNTTAATTTTINKYMNTYKYRKYTYRLYLEKKIIFIIIFLLVILLSIIYQSTLKYLFKYFLFSRI